MKIANFLFLLFPGGLLAQNWMPISPGETYHYRLHDSSYITHTLYVDSLKIQGADSIFFLNRVLDWYDTGWETIALYKQGQFLGKTMTRKPDGSFLFESENLFFDTSIVIYPNAITGETWLAVANGNVMASVTSIVEGEVLGMPDSLKTIHFSNGAEWVLTKNHGLLSGTDLNEGNLVVTLSGLEHQGLGDRLYRFEDFFDFNIGDLFESESSFTGIQTWGETRQKTTILEKEVLPVGFRYFVERKRKTVVWGLFPSTTIVIDSGYIQYLRQDFPHITAYNKEAISLAAEDYFDDEISFAKHFDGGIQIGFIDPPFICPVLEIPTDPDNYLTYIDDALVCAPEGNFSSSSYIEKYVSKLGRVLYFVAVSDNTVSNWLSGAVIQGDTLWGKVTPDWYFTKTSEPPLQTPPLKIFPNPCSDWSSIEIPIQAESTAKIQVFSTEGSLVSVQECSRSEIPYQLKLSGMKAGVYFIVLQSEAAVWRGKLVKTH